MKYRSKIIHEDNEIVLMDKASGALTIPDRFKPELFNLYNWLGKKYGKIFTVHRLDRETSGLLVFAKTEKAHKHLSQQFEERSVEKIYQVLVDGVMHETEGEIDKPIGKHPAKSGRMIVSAKGKPSLTLFRVTERFKNYSLVEANIKTGRTHQIRVHFKSIGYPLAVDADYGRSEAFYLSKVKRKYKIWEGARGTSLDGPYFPSCTPFGL